MTCGLYCYSKEELGGKIALRKKSLRTDRGLEWGDSERGEVGKVLSFSCCFTEV